MSVSEHKKGAVLFVILFFITVFSFAQTNFFPEVLDEIARSEARYKKQLSEVGGITLAPSDNYDLKYAQLYISPSVMNDTPYVSGSVKYIFERLEGLGAIAFDLSESIRVSNVSQGTNSLDFFQSGNVLTIELPPSSGTADSVIIEFGGVPKGSGFGSFGVQKEGADSSYTIWTLSEPYGARDWFPCKMTLTDKLDSVEVTVTHQKDGYMGVSNGLLKEVRCNDEDKYCSFRWKHTYPIATYLIAVAVAKYDTFSTTAFTSHGNLPIQCFAYRDKKEEWKNDVQHVVNCMQLFDTLLGEYPFIREQYAQTQFGWGGGMEHQTNSFMANLGFELVAHELAHQWFGNKITCASWQDIWLNEGFATYCSGLAYEHIQPQWWRAFRETNHRRATDIADGSVFVDDTTDVSRIFSSRLSYSKGAYVLHGLRWLLGDSLFFATLHSYLNDENLAYGFAKTSDFQRHCELVSGMDLTCFFNQWIYGKGFAQYKLLWSQRATDVSFQLFQTPSDNSVSFFQMPVPVYVKEENGNDTTFVLDHVFSGQKFSFQYAGKIDSVLIDRDLWLISKNNEVWQLTDIENTSELHIFPNPAKSRLSVLFNSAKINQPMISIFDKNGRLVLQQAHVTGQVFFNVNIEFLAPGTYICKLTDGNEFLNAKKFMKQ